MNKQASRDSIEEHRNQGDGTTTDIVIGYDITMSTPIQTDTHRYIYVIYICVYIHGTYIYINICIYMYLYIMMYI